MRIIFALLVALVGCAPLGVSHRASQITVEIINNNFYPANLEMFCDSLPLPPKIIQIDSRRRKSYDISRCASVGWEVTLLASSEKWNMRGVMVNPGDTIRIQLENTLFASTWMVRGR